MRYVIFSHKEFMNNVAHSLPGVHYIFITDLNYPINSIEKISLRDAHRTLSFSLFLALFRSFDVLGHGG